jgi:hypothetical protein
MNKPLINALNCALAVLRGTGGGFSPHEKANAIDVIDIEMRRLIQLELEQETKASEETKNG